MMFNFVLLIFTNVYFSVKRVIKWTLQLKDESKFWSMDDMTEAGAILADGHLSLTQRGALISLAVGGVVELVDACERSKTDNVDEDHL